MEISEEITFTKELPLLFSVSKGIKFTNIEFFSNKTKNIQDKSTKIY